MNFYGKSPEIFKNEVIGYWYTFDCDIEIYVGINGEIEDYSGCGYERAIKLINSTKRV